MLERNVFSVGLVVAATLCVSSLGFVSSAIAQESKNVVLLNLPGPKTTQNTKTLRDALHKVGGYGLVAEHQYIERAANRGVADATDFSTPTATVTTCRADSRGIGLDAVVAGELSDGGVIQLHVYNGADGSELGVVALKTRRGFVAANVARKAAKELSPLLEVSTHLVPEPEPPAAEPVKPSGPVAEQNYGIRDELDNPNEGSSLTPLSVTGGVSGIRRRYTMGSNGQDVDFDGSFYPAIRMSVLSYGLGSVTDVLSPVALRLTFARGSDTVSLADGSSRPLTHTEFGGAMGYRIALGDRIFVEPELGLDFVTVSISDNELLESTAYALFSTGLRLGFVPMERLQVTAYAAAIPFVGQRTNEDLYGAASAFGLAAGASGELQIFSGLFTAIGYNLRLLDATFDGSGSSGLMEVETTDAFHELSLALGYRL